MRTLCLLLGSDLARLQACLAFWTTSAGAEIVSGSRGIAGERSTNAERDVVELGCSRSVYRGEFGRRGRAEIPSIVGDPGD